ncbi:MAG TPA: aminopeptidase [Bacilli bacterium]|nr:aminopeptidase [Bacilli bacterium]
MKDPRCQKLARQLIRYSLQLQPGDKLLISSTDGECELTRELIAAAYEAGALPFLKTKETQLTRELIKGATREQLELMARMDNAMLAEMDAYLGVVKLDNVHQLSRLPREQRQLWNRHYHQAVRIPPLNKKWCLLRFPNHAMAQAAALSTEELEDLFFEVSTFDYANMSRAMKPLVERIRRARRVRITGPGTDLSFELNGMPVIASDGRHNVPDGEVFTAPVRESVEGTVAFNTPSFYRGFFFDRIRLTFHQGQVVAAEANDTQRLEQILDTDAGSRFVGEFAFGLHPLITEPLQDVLFDEKIAGSFHLALGNAYPVADNGNRSLVHWDLVAIQTPEQGGGEIWFDDELIRRDGQFVPADLQALNPGELLEESRELCETS